MTTTSTVFGGETMISRALDNREPDDARELTTNEIDAISGGVAFLAFAVGMAVGASSVLVGMYAAEGAFDAIDFSRLRELG
jgi:lactobin A/cerein 7B family class IIb bacteriocin